MYQYLNNMKTKTRKEIDNTIIYLLDESFSNLEGLKEDPANVLWESGLDLPDDEYAKALEYVTKWHR